MSIGTVLWPKNRAQVTSKKVNLKYTINFIITYIITPSLDTNAKMVTPEATGSRRSNTPVNGIEIGSLKEGLYKNVKVIFKIPNNNKITFN